MGSRKHLTAAEFDAVLPLLDRLSDNRLEAARRVLVDGETLQAVGDRFGWSRQAANDAVTRVWQTVERYRECLRRSGFPDVTPPGWERVALIAPAPLAQQMRALVAKELAALDPDKPDRYATLKAPRTDRRGPSNANGPA